MQLLRVNSNNELVVPPFECAWLSDETLQLEEEAGCIAFEVKGEVFNLTSCVKTVSQRLPGCECGCALSGTFP